MSALFDFIFGLLQSRQNASIRKTTGTFMKKNLILLVCAIAFFRCETFAADTTNATVELENLVGKIRTDIGDGKRTETELADDLKQFDALLAEHKGEKTDDVAKILYMKATLYREVIGDDKKADELMTQLKSQFKDTKFVTEIVQMEERRLAAKKVQDSLVAGATFPDFSEKDLEGNSISAAGYKGKIVLIDFWATWCGPCREEMPNVIDTYVKYHDKGFDIIGISLDEDRTTLENFLKENKISWPQYFDGKGWENKVAMKYGVESIPATILIGRDGKIIGKDFRGEELTQAVAKALEK